MPQNPTPAAAGDTNPTTAHDALLQKGLTVYEIAVVLGMHRAEVLAEAADAIQDMERRNAWAVRPMTSSLYAEFLRGLSGGAVPVADSPTGDDEASLCRCGHGAAYHDAKYSDPQCRLCPEDGERMWRHPFTPADAFAPSQREAGAL
ncbi:hypothetical protein [Streptomyces microflavus]|uniref:hypothetical protein n=1 Tax=Streptomyces microflavus TaxID=1919 RepID=UPI002E36AB2F|nr:hypothetical protein [Streptomyces microflavus]